MIHDGGNHNDIVVNHIDPDEMPDCHYLPDQTDYKQHRKDGADCENGSHRFQHRGELNFAGEFDRFLFERRIRENGSHDRPEH